MVQGALRPDLASMTMNDALNGCQSYTGPLKRVDMMQALEHSK